MEELLWCPERREWAFHFEQQPKKKGYYQVRCQKRLPNKTNKTNCAIQNKNIIYNGQKIYK